MAIRASITKERGHLIVLWLGAAILLGGLLGFARINRSGLDDADPARQRPGFLDAGLLPLPAPALEADRPRPGNPAVVFFVRRRDVDPLCRSLTEGGLAQRADVVVVAAGPGRCDGTTVIVDRQDRLARAYGLPQTRERQTQVGYAVVDGDGQIRYRTLDPVIAGDLSEVNTVLRAIE